MFDEDEGEPYKDILYRAFKRRETQIPYLWTSPCHWSGGGRPLAPEQAQLERFFTTRRVLYIMITSMVRKSVSCTVELSWVEIAGAVVDRTFKSYSVLHPADGTHLRVMVLT